MFTVDEYRARYTRSNTGELRTLLEMQPERLAPEARQALAEEAARRGIRASSTLGLQRYPKAPSSDRFGAYIFDKLVGFGPAITAMIFDVVLNITQSDTSMVINILATFSWAIYYALAKDGHGNGQSIGKKMFHLMVIKVDTGEPCSMGQSIGRGVVGGLLGWIPVLGALIEPIAVLATSDGRRLADRAAGTQVIASTVYEASVRA